MAIDCDKINFAKIKPEITSFGTNQDSNVKDERKENISAKLLSYQDDERKKLGREIKVQNNEATEERQRTGRYLAIGVTLIMLFIAFYHTLLRHATFLAGLLAPAIIMLLYILWLFYFAKKKKTQVSNV